MFYVLNYVGIESVEDAKTSIFEHEKVFIRKCMIEFFLIFAGNVKLLFLIWLS